MNHTALLANSEQTFVCRSYSFQELALLYNPHTTPKNASKILSNWIRETRGLQEALEQYGWKPRARNLSPKIVACLIQYLGEP